MRHVQWPTGDPFPVVGQGTWRMGEAARSASDEVAALRRGLDLGLTLIDTAEMYGDGSAEEVVGQAIVDRRHSAFLVSKVYPQNASRRAMAAHCEASLKRLGTDHLDLYLLHWRGSIPLAESVEAFERLVQAGRIRAWGVSNFDVEDMNELLAAGGERCATNQVLYNLSRRGPEFDLFPWMTRRGMPVMAYSPVEQGRLPATDSIKAMARRHGASLAQVALAFVIRQSGVMAIPKASTMAHVEENARAIDLHLEAEDWASLDRDFPPPRHKQSLEML